MLRAPFALIWNILKLLSYAFRAFFFSLGHLLTRKQRKWVRLKLPKRLLFGPPSGLAKYFQDKVSYLELREEIDVIAGDSRIEGVVLTSDHLQHGPARTSDLRALVQRLRRAGKSIIFHSHTIHGRDYDLATSADQILMTPGGRFYLFGYRFEQFFAASLLQRLGVAPQFVHIGPFKGAAHRFIHTESTPALRLMMQQLLDGLSDIRETRIRTERSIDEARLEKSFERMPVDDGHAEAFGLIDARIHRRFLARWLEEGDQFADISAPPMEDENTEEEPRDTGLPADRSPRRSSSPSTSKGESSEKEQKEPQRKVSIKDARSYVEAHPGPYDWTPLFRPQRKVATIDLSGMIVMPDMELPGHSLATIDPSEVLPALRKMAADRSVAAVVLHINSPGGSALASELIWDGIRRLRQEKPTVAYCSDIAASGGYYMAVAADRIICQPETVTGSIGVIAGKFSFPGTLERAEVNSESFFRHKTSLFESLTEPLSEEVLQNLKEDARAFYRQFLRRVGDSRQLPHRRLHRYARGRVYTGADAESRFLVDHLGGFDDAVTLARSLTRPELPESTPVTFQSHRTVGLPALLKQSASSPSPLADAFGDAQLLHTLIQRDPMLALMPHRIESWTLPQNV